MRLVYLLSVILLALPSQAEPSQGCDVNCLNMKSQIEANFSGAASWTSGTGTQAIKVITYSVLKSPYLEVWLLGIDTIAEALSSSPPEVKARAISSLSTIALLSESETIKLVVLDLLEERIAKPHFHPRIQAINAVANIGMGEASNLIKHRAIEVLAVGANSIIGTVSDHARLQIPKVQSSIKKSSMLDFD